MTSAILVVSGISEIDETRRSDVYRRLLLGLTHGVDASSETGITAYHRFSNARKRVIWSDGDPDGKMSSIARSTKLSQPLGAIRKQHVASAVQSSRKFTETLYAPFKIPLNDQTSSLSPKEQAELQQFASELNVAYQSGEPTEQHVLRALEVIRPMVRPLRKGRKRQNDEMRKGGNSVQGSIKSIGENFAIPQNAATNVRHIATQLHPRSSLPPLGCPLPIPLEKKHSDTLRALLDPEAFQDTTQTNSSSTTSPDLLSAWTRESLLRLQEALYDILLVRSTLTYWLYFARIQLKKAQRKALIDAITGIRKVAKNQLAIAGKSGKTKKPVIDNELERYALFKYQARSTEKGQGLQAATSVAIPVQKQPLFSWDALFGGLSSVKQAYQREAFEAKARTISYSLSRGAGNEVSMHDNALEQRSDGMIAVDVDSATENSVGECYL